MEYMLLSTVFLCGLLVGLLLVGSIVLFFLTGTSVDRGSGGTGNGSSAVALHEQPFSVEDQKALECALRKIHETAMSTAPKGAGGTPREGSASPNGTQQDMIAEFTALSQDAIERQKQNKVLCGLLADFGKLHGAFSKEMLRLSHVAEEYVRTDNQKPIDKWWNSFSIALDHMAQDHEFVSNSLCPGFTSDLSRIEQEHVIKKVQAHGAKCVSRLKDAMAVHDARSKELLKLREKVTQCSAGGNLSVGEHSKLVLKIDTCETAMKAAAANMVLVQAELEREMPSILNDYNLIAHSATDATASILVSITDVLVSAQAKSTHILKRLKLDIASIASKVIDKNSTDPLVLEILERIERGDDPVLVDMKTETIAAMASSLFPAKARLPRQFGRCIGEETCVWLNAFAGRMYRDVARSEAFHEWCCTKASYLLNKGKRPDFVDVYHVSDVVFGAAPPSIRNVKWLPHCPLVSGQKDDPEHNVACSADICFRSGISFTVNTKLWINWPRDRYAFIPVKMKVEVSEVIGRVHFGVQKRASFLSFIEEPYTRFAVKSEVGGDYKLTDIPRVSNLVIQKIKKYIRNKVCFPKAYKTRVLWPKKWWPHGEDEYKESSSSKIEVDKNTGDTAAAAKADVGSNVQVTETVVPIDQINVSVDLSKSTGLSTGLLTSTGAAMRDNLSRWIFKPLMSGKRNSKLGLGSTNKGNNEESDDDSTDDEAHAMFEALKPYRTDLAATKELWENHIKRCFYQSQSGQKSDCDDLIIVPSVSRAIDSKTIQACSNRDAYVTKSRSIDPADTIPLSIRRIADVHPTKIAARDAESILRRRSYSVADFRSESIALCAFYYFSYGSGRQQIHDPAVVGKEETNCKASRYTSNNISISRISRTLSMRLAHAGTLLQHRRLKHGERISSKSWVSQKPLNPRTRIQHDGFFLSTSPRKEDEANICGDMDQSLELGTHTSKPKISNLFKIGRQLEKAKDVLKSGLRRPDNRKSGSDSVDVVGGSPLNDLNSETSRSEDVPSPAKMSANDADIPSKSKTGSNEIKIKLPTPFASAHHETSPSLSACVKLSPGKVVDPEKEAESLAWQARAQALSEASNSGEFPSMQGFLLMKQNIPGCKKWVVLRQGNLGVFNSPGDNTKYGVPLTHVNLLGAICRPSSKEPSCLEIGIPMETSAIEKDSKASSATTLYWMPFWADSEVQCRAWVMAVQQSALQLHYEKTGEKK